MLIFDDMGADGPLAGFEALVGKVLEAEAGGVVGGSLLGVTDP